MQTSNIMFFFFSTLHEVNLNCTIKGEHCSCDDQNTRIVKFAYVKETKFDESTAYLLPSLYFNFRKCNHVENQPRKSLIEDVHLFVSWQVIDWKIVNL